MNFIDIALQALELASETLEDSKLVNIAVQKGDRDYATNVDLGIEQTIRAFLSQATPDIPMVGEEFSPSIANFDKAWVLDPIDGTVNYFRRHPLFGVGLALVSPQTPLVAAVRLPKLGKTYLAELGSGATCNSEKISVSSTSELGSAVVAFGDFSVGPQRIAENEKRIRQLSALIPHILRARMHGAATVDMCFVAEGAIDASIILSNNLWDIQAGVLIVREAGGVVVDHLGAEHRIESETTIAASSSIITELLPLLRPQ